MEIPISPNTDGSVNSKSHGEATTEELATLRILNAISVQTSSCLVNQHQQY